MLKQQEELLTLLVFVWGDHLFLGNPFGPFNL